MPSEKTTNKTKEKAGVRGAAPAPSPIGAGKPSAPTAGMSRVRLTFTFGGVVVADGASF